VLLILLGIFIGAIVAVPVARFVKMTAMPSWWRSSTAWVAARPAWCPSRVHPHQVDPPATYVTLEVLLGVLIGTVSFAGSAIAFAKLQELMTGRPSPTRPAGHQRIIGAVALVLIVTILVNGSTVLLWCCSPSPSCSASPSCCDRRSRRAGADLAAERLHRTRGRGVGFTLGSNL